MAEHPDSVDARRALRAAQREQKSRQEPKATGSDGYPELEATFQAARTRRAEPDGQATLDGHAATELAPTVVAGHAQAPRRPPLRVPWRSASGIGRRGWLGAAGALVAVAALAWAVLWRAAPPVTSGAAGAATPAAAASAPAPTEAKAAPVAPANALHALRVRSQPPGATVALDGGAAAGVTPLELSFDPASEHRISFSLEGYAAQEVRTRPGAPPAALEVTLEKLVPPGGVAVASAYELDVVWRGRTLAKGQASPRVQLAGGRQVLTLLSSAVFLKADVTVDVPPGGEVAIEAPGLGKLNVRATPDNCEVFVNDVFVDYPPILDRPVAAGRHSVSFRWPDGARSQQAVEVKAGAPAFVDRPQGVGVRRARLRLAALVWLAAIAAAQETPDQQARRLLEDGREYLAQGKQKQALDNFNIVVIELPDHRLGRAGADRDRPLPHGGEGDAAKARAAFDQVTKQHARSDAAPGAYYYLGLLTLNRATTAPEIEDALAQFARVETLYPTSTWVPRAIAAQALAHRRAGRYAEATDLNRRVSLEYPASDAAAGAQYEIGRALALAGQARQAMEEFQQVRNRFPDSAWAEPALQRTTALYRLFGAQKPAFAPDPAFAAGAGDVLKDVRALLWLPRPRSGSPRTRRRAPSRSRPAASSAPASPRSTRARCR